MNEQHIFVFYIVALGAFLLGGILRFFGGKEFSDDKGNRDTGIRLILLSIILVLMAHLPHLKGG